MRLFATIILMLVLAAGALAYDLGNAASPKPAIQHTPPPIDPEMLRQGGDTIADAVELTIPVWELVGTTVGYTDDYDEACPYTQSTSPDVVYTFVSSQDAVVDIDMFGSGYDTKIYVYDENLELVACNDDFYPDYTSKIEFLALDGGVRYYLVIDGYGGDAGEYVLSINEWIIEQLECPMGAVLEDEPPLAVDYVDEHNGGCNNPDAPDAPRFQHIASQMFCGVSGWYLYEGSTNRDTDWFTVTLPASGTLTITGDADYHSYIFELGPQECDVVGVLQNIEIGPFNPGYMILTGEPGATVWIWVGPTTFEAPNGQDVDEYLYILMLDDPVSVKNHSWTGVKALFD